MNQDQEASNVNTQDSGAPGASATAGSTMPPTPPTPDVPATPASTDAVAGGTFDSASTQTPEKDAAQAANQQQKGSIVNSIEKTVLQVVSHAEAPVEDVISVLQDVAKVRELGPNQSVDLPPINTSEFGNNYQIQISIKRSE